MSNKFTTYAFIALLLSGIVVSCLTTFDELTYDHQEIVNCFQVHNRTNHPTITDVTNRLHGGWVISETETVKFDDNGYYTVYRDIVILDAGYYKIYKDNDLFVLQTSRKNLLLDGPIFICSIHIFNVNNNLVWTKIY